ncbi:MAG: CaiB/BaiF CoA transferase family protein [Halobacteriota archaeon]|uniref:CaiB/BaiF CoA transferase family protein n=1 Tax=Natronomonas sp. TaxID=2184060 RepID=UPI0039750A6A
MTRLPLEGVRVLDLTRLLPGPYATQLLGDLGADVIKIEEPRMGDYYREEEPKLADGNSRIFAMLNRNKRSLALDLKDERGHEAFMQLAETADVIVEGFRPGVVGRLNIDYESVSERNESIVYCSLSGYGQNGPYEQWAGHDVNYIGIGGLLHMTGEPDEDPVIPGMPVADFAGGMMTTIAAMVGLRSAEATGEGEYFDLAMTDIIVSWLTLYAPHVFDDASTPPERGGTMPAGKYPCYAVYATADGGHVTLGAMEYKFWEATCEELGLDEYANPDDHFPEGKRSAEIRSTLAETFAERSREEWLDRLDPEAIPVAPVNDVGEVWEDPQIRHREMVTQMDTEDGSVPVVNTPIRPEGDYDYVRSEHPGLGEQSAELLAELDIDGETIESMFEDGVTTEPDQ